MDKIQLFTKTGQFIRQVEIENAAEVGCVFYDGECFIKDREDDDTAYFQTKAIGLASTPPQFRPIGNLVNACRGCG